MSRGSNGRNDRWAALWGAVSCTKGHLGQALGGRLPGEMSRAGAEYAAVEVKFLSFRRERLLDHGVHGEYRKSRGRAAPAVGPDPGELALLGPLARSFITNAPERFRRIVADQWPGATGWPWCGQVLLHLVELIGLGEALQLLWGLIFRLRPLTEAEHAASKSVHPPGLIPYRQVRVDDDSYLIKIGTTLADWCKTKVSPRTITTMHIIHAPAGGLSMPLAVHELTHVGQYEKVGAIYMPQALHAQGSSEGYDYGNLTDARAAGKRFADFNREQQASICEDYYQVRNGMSAKFGATDAELGPFIADMRAGNF